MKLFGREPALWLEAIKAVLVFLALVLPLGLTVDFQNAVMVIFTAAFGLWQAFATHPFQVAALKEFIQTVGIAVGAFGLHFSPTLLAAVIVLVGTISTLLTRAQVTPKADPRPLTATA